MKYKILLKAWIIKETKIWIERFFSPKFVQKIFDFYLAIFVNIFLILIIVIYLTGLIISYFFCFHNLNKMKLCSWFKKKKNRYLPSIYNKMSLDLTCFPKLTFDPEIFSFLTTIFLSSSYKCLKGWMTWTPTTILSTCQLTVRWCSFTIHQDTDYSEG